ncbi:hypothetical protein EVAR_76377_1 [Eumeta japonica]|uniref:Uncharacterized protein n=1 Tax=Eumeta variegata TaxID=151549 RepID=A0A4C1T7Y8_EUMVA|nr:hypothetical protein EVAR_76377_1 [Eumeta japonica]
MASKDKGPSKATVYLRFNELKFDREVCMKFYTCVSSRKEGGFFLGTAQCNAGSEAAVQRCRDILKRYGGRGSYSPDLTPCGFFLSREIEKSTQGQTVFNIGGNALPAFEKAFEKVSETYWKM